MKKKVLFCSILLICLCLVLMGCEINVNVNDDEDKEEKESKTKSVLVGDYEEVDAYYYNNYVDYSYIDLGDQYYIIVFGNDDDGYTTWTYETEKSNHADEISTEYLGCYDDKVVYLLDNGVITLLDAKNGEIIFQNDSQLFTMPYYDLNYDNGNIYFFLNDNYTEFLALDKKGNILKDIDLTEYDFELSFIPSSNWNINIDEDTIKMVGATEAENYEEKMVTIQLKNFKVTVKDLEHEELTNDKLVGKVLTYEYAYETYCFNEDGTFEQICNNDFACKYAILRYKGNWHMEEDDLLVLNITELVLADGGHYEYDEEYARSLVDYEEKTIAANMEYTYIVRYYPDYDGKECISLDGVLYELLEPVG